MGKNNRTVLRLMWHHAWQRPGYVIGLLIMLPITLLLHQFLPQLIAASVLNRLSHGDFSQHHIWASFGPALLLYGASLISGAIIGWRIVIYLLWRTEMRIVREISQRTFDHLLQLSAHFHANHFGGSLVSQSTNLANSYVRFQDLAIFTILPLFFSLLFAIGLLLPRAPIVVAVLLVVTTFYLVVALLTSRKVGRLRVKEVARRNEQTGLLADVVTNVMAVKSFAGEDAELARYWQAGTHVVTAENKLMWASLRRQTYFAGTSTTMDVSSLILAVVSVMLFNADIATVFLVLNYTSNVLFKLWDFSGNGLRQLNQAFGEAQAMAEILEETPSVRNPAKPQKSRITKGEIEFKNMTFSHADARTNDVLFTGLNLRVPAGSKVGLVGHSGSGKTTLTKLLLHFADIDSGSITIDGQNIAAITQQDLRRHIAYVPQEPMLFHRSIAENISYGKPGASMAEIKNAANLANAAEFIEKLPAGYDTEVGERGVKLSGGQRQRIAIARAILKDAPILVLDEATSALDSESEQLIQSSLWKLMKGRTAIVIAHRLSTIQKMDRIVVLQEGEIIEQGDHQKLLAKNGTYAKLWARQSGGFLED